MTEPCPNCGRLNRPGARFCASCQAPLDAAAPAPSGPPPAAPLSAGQLLAAGSYRVLRPLGKGGMGAVWLVAQTRAFDRLAVLKEVIDYFDPLDPEARQKAIERFEAEARTLGDLKHPGIPDLYAYFTEAGHNYLVMEYIEGQDLASGLTHEDRSTGRPVPGGPLPVADVVDYAIEICEVLEYLERREPPVVHNDIKPANIIVDKHSQRAVLVDFGTAKTRYLAAAGRPDQARASVYGTVGYAAPELYQGRSEPRSDVYALAATVYHVITDDDPADHPAQFPLLDSGSLPAALAAILHAALVEDVRQRLSASEFRTRLAAFLAGQTGPLRAMSFPNGDAASDRDELVALAARHWRYAAGLLMDGTLANWLRGTLHDTQAAQAAEGAARQWPADPDAALDALIRQLDPGGTVAPPGKMELRTHSLSLQVGYGQRSPASIEVANRGTGYLRGKVYTSQPWARLPATTFACPPGRTCTVQLEIDAAGLAPGQKDVAAVTFEPSNGAPDIVAVQVAVVAPAVRVEPARVDFGTVSRRGPAPAVRQVTVTNTTPATADCRVQATPGWLAVKPDAFRLAPGAAQPVSLILRPDRAGGGSQEAVLIVIVDKGQAQQVVVSVRVKGVLF